MILNIYKKLVIDFPKLTIFLILTLIILFLLFHAKNFNLDASSDALIFRRR